MWFQTADKTNEEMIKELRFFPVKIIEMWECKKCMNIIFTKKYTYSPLAKQDDIFTDHWMLENVIVRIQDNKRAGLAQVDPRSEKFVVMNAIKIYCKVCDKKLLGEFKPFISIEHAQFKYLFESFNENLKKSKILMGKCNYHELSIKNSILLGQNKSHNNLTVLKQVCQQINQYVAMWYYSKNFKIYKPFVSESKKCRQYLMEMKGFMIKTNTMKQKGEKQSFRFRIKQNSCSNNSASLNN